MSLTKKQRRVKRRTMPMSKLLGLDEVEERTNIKRPTWRSWVRQGRLAHVKLGTRVLISENDLAAFLAAHRRPARAKASLPPRRGA
jgi:excisionase family DNA binding protein